MGSAKPNLFWKNLSLVVVFLILTPIALMATLMVTLTIEPNNTNAIAKDKNTDSRIGVSVYASLPSNIPSISGHITMEDARPQIVKQYLEEYNSPLVDYANEIVQMADKYGIDYRFIPAIARQESNLCHIIPPGSYNCWGWGITSVSSLGFKSYDEAIETVTKGLKNDYINDGLVTPEEIMTKYTPSSNGSWARGVNEFMSEMQ